MNKQIIKITNLSSSAKLPDSTHTKMTHDNNNKKQQVLVGCFVRALFGLWPCQYIRWLNESNDFECVYVCMVLFEEDKWWHIAKYCKFFISYNLAKSS